ncbi:hypothetical protein MIND_00887900 [Mycena indigotica]|uniref:Uncharacterized protein n=1 Tax=Mycena indigotica TaxID=2126181 RepID=A0A8H6W1D1_9AGAR|nr:uncharacterized protein MIND_00887900 [Mycena indigotica]KAF7299386.1 hypothetical protein MIND_00887900 [Mycena indigotica]
MSSTSDCDFDARSWGLDLSDEVIKLLNDNFEKMLEFVKPTWEKENIPMWEPPENIRGTLSPDRLDFIRNLRIPSFEPSSTPSLLLHELGNYAEDQNMDQRIQELFKKGCLTCVMNCSGAGKTRHALEALCHQWGFYFCLKDKEGDLGSGDMNNIIHRLTLRKEKGYFTSHLPRYSNDDEFEKFKAKLENNQLCAQSCFIHVIIARILLFRLFITAIVKSGRKISASDKRRWTLLQIHPAFLGSINADIFLDLARYLDSPNYAQRKLIPTMTTDGFEELWQQILQAVSELITAHSDHPPDQKVDNKAYSFVLDEAQLAAGMRNAFRSGEPNSRGIYEQRPLLREFIVILNFLVLAGLAAILTGTGLDIEVIEDAAHSVAYKGTPRYSMFKTTIGGFYEDPRAHIAYLNKFVPPDVLSRESLIKRMSIWLTGRYRTTASAISYLLETGFENPHDELDNWIMLNTGFIPSDSPNSEIRLPLNIGEHRNTLIKQLKYSKIAKSASTRELFVNTIFESFVRSSALDITRASHVLVEAGFARFTQKEKLGETCLFEPLIILAAIWQIEQAENEQGSARNAFGEYFMRKVESATLTRLGSQHNGFESYVALVLARAFGNFAPLSDVFSFDEKYNPVWMRNRRARLVSIHREDGPGSTARGISAVSVGARRLLSSGSIIATPFRAPICFPSQNMGPDVILKLQLDDDDGSFVWVVVQCKNWSGGEKIHGDPAQIAEKEKKAIKTVTPRKFLDVTKWHRLQTCKMPKFA